MQTSNQNYVLKPVRSAAILTNSYVAGTVIGLDPLVEMNNQLVILAKFVVGSLTSAEIKVEFSPDGTTYYQESFSSISTTTDTLSLGEHKMGGTGNFRIAIPIKDRYIKISAKGTGTVTSSSLAIDAIVGVA
jgi:hypothetical protein